MDLQKAPIINILLLLLITHFYIIGKINWKQIALFLLLSIGLLFIMYVLFMGISREGLLQTLQNPFHRAFIGTVSPLFWWQLYVEQHGYLNGLSLPNPRHIFDFEHVKISVEIMEFVRPELKDIGVVGSMPAVFWADWFINFGVYTIFISMILFGFLIQSLDILFIAYIKNKKSILILALFIYILFYFKRYITTTYFGIIFDPNIILPIIFIVSLNYILQKIGKKKI